MDLLGVGPDISGPNDYDNIKQAIAGGRGEMPALGASLSQSDIDAIAKYVVETLAPPPVAAGHSRPLNKWIARGEPEDGRAVQS